MEEIESYDDFERDMLNVIRIIENYYNNLNKEYKLEYKYGFDYYEKEDWKVAKQMINFPHLQKYLQMEDSHLLIVYSFIFVHIFPIRHRIYFEFLTEELIKDILYLKEHLLADYTRPDNGSYTSSLFLYLKHEKNNIYQTLFNLSCFTGNILFATKLYILYPDKIDVEKVSVYEEHTKYIEDIYHKISTKLLLQEIEHYKVKCNINV